MLRPSSDFDLFLVWNSPTGREEDTRQVWCYRHSLVKAGWTQDGFGGWLPPS